MEFIIGLIVAFFVIRYLYTNAQKNRIRKEHDEVEKSLTPKAWKFDLDPQYVLTKKKIDRQYVEYKRKIRNNEETSFENLSDLELTYNDLLREAELRDRLMAEMTGRRIEFYD
ncbi:MAG: hypothetical protein AAFO07_01750 [Bacteroidota bacterium]